MRQPQRDRCKRGGFHGPNDSRPLVIQELECRHLLAAGDLLYSIPNDSNVGQSSAEFGFATDVDGTRLVVGAPTADASGLPSVGEAYIFDTATGDLLVTLRNPNPMSGDQFGHAVAISGQRVVIGGFTSDIGATDAGIAYVFDVATGDLLQSIPNPTPAAFDYFGYSVAIDGNTIVVGAYLDDTAANDGGAAYIIDAQTGTVQHTLTRTTAAQFDYTGFSVSVAGNIVVVGASRTDVGALDAGEVLLFDATTGNAIGTILNPTPQNFDYFGRAVAATADRLAISAYRDNQGAVSSGAAYVYDIATRVLQRTFVNPTPAVGDNFGWSIDLLGDQLLIGAYRDDLGARDSGVAYQFNAVSGSLVHTLANPTPGELDYFATTVSISNDLAIVGARWDDTQAFDAGHVYFFSTQSGQLVRNLASPAKSSFDYFGYDVAISEEHLVVGAHLDDTSGTDAGIVRVFEAATGAFQRMIIHPAPGRFDLFGFSISLSGNWLAVGTPSHDGGGIVDSGTVYLFDITTGTLLSTIRSPVPTAGDNFGYSVSLVGDLLAVGAHRADRPGAADAGRAYVFDVTSGTLLHELLNPLPNTSDNFGSAISVSNSGLVAVGSALDDTAGQNAGSVYVFDFSTGALISSLVEPSPAGFNQFGTSIAMRGSQILIGSPRNSTTALNAGAAYLFDAVGGSMFAEITSPVPMTSSLFGGDVALSADFAVIGSYAANTGVPLSGAAYLFDATTGQFRNELFAPPPPATNYFGYSVALSQSYTAVGAPLTDGLNTDRGAAYVYDAGIAIDLPPIADAGGPYAGVEGQPIQLDGSGSSDPPNNSGTLLFEWDLDYDGLTFDVDEMGISPTVTFDHEVAARTIALRVTDAALQATIDQAILEILNADPEVAVDNVDVSTNESTLASNTGTYSDSGSDVVTLSANIGEVVANLDGTWSWSFAATDGPDESQLVTVTALDEDGGTASVEFNLSVINVDPDVAVDDVAVSVDEGTLATNTGTYSDIGNDLVTLSANIGEVVDNPDGTWSWSFAATDGPDESQLVTVTALDEDGGTASVEFDLTVSNIDPEVAVDNVAVSVDEGALATNTGTYSDIGNDLVTLSANIGEVVANPDGTWSWSFAATDDPDESQLVTVTAMDGDGGTASIEFNLTVSNVVPEVAVDNVAVSANEGTLATNTGTYSDSGGDVVTLSANIGEVVANPDGTWSWSFAPTDGPDESQLVTITALDGDGGMASVEFDLSVINSPPTINAQSPVVLVNGGTAVNSGTYGDVGADTVTLSVNLGVIIDNLDGTWSWSYTDDGSTETQTVTVTATDSDQDFMVTTFELVAAIIVAENLEVTANEGTLATNTGYYVLPANGETLQLTASIGDVIDHQNGSWSWSWTANDSLGPSVSVTIEAVYSGGTTAMVEFTVVTTNLAPFITVNAAVTTVNRGVIATNGGTFGDVGGDSVTLTASIGSVVDNGDGTWSWSWILRPCPVSR